MSENVDDPWAKDVEVHYLTDTDLQASRNMGTMVSDQDRELHRLVETLRQHEELSNWSEACDRALRVELSHAIDNERVTFRREDYDVAYTIPPTIWLEQVFPEVPLVPECDVDTSDPAIGFSTPTVCHEMAKEAIEDGSYNLLTEIVQSGAERLLGYQ